MSPHSDVMSVSADLVCSRGAGAQRRLPAPGVVIAVIALLGCPLAQAQRPSPATPPSPAVPDNSPAAARQRALQQRAAQRPAPQPNRPGTPIQTNPPPPFTSPGAAPLEPAPAGTPLIGAWKGVYYTYPNVMAMDVEFQPFGNGPTSGTLTFHPAVQDRSTLGVSKGSYQFTAAFDEASRTFVLKPGAWVERPNSGGMQVPLVGVFDAGSSTLAGTFENRSAPNPPFFVLAPAATGEQLVSAIIRSAHPSPEDQARAKQLIQKANTARTMRTVTQGMPPEVAAQMERAQQRARVQQQARREEGMKAISNLPPAMRDQAMKAMQQRDALEAPANEAESSWSPPTPAAIVQWASRLKSETSATDLRNQNFEKIYLLARNLFAAETFKPCFGIAYEDMTPYQRLQVVSLLTKDQQQLREQQQLLEYQALFRPFQLVGDFGAPDITVSIYWQRTVRAWVRDMNSALGSLPAARASFASMTKTEAMAAAELAFLWPSERDQLATALAQARARLAVPVLTEAAGSLIAAARDLSGARDLASWDQREAELLQYAPPSDRAELQQRIADKEDSLLEQLLAGEVRAIPGFGHGLAAAEAGARWYQALAKNYAFAATRPPYQKALQQFQQARSRTLGEATVGIMGKLEGSSSEDEIKSMLASYLSCPGDESTEAARALHQLADTRLSYVRKQAILAKYSDKEQELMDPDHPGQLNLSKLRGKQPWAPSEKEVRLALLRGFAFGTGEVLDPYTARMTSRMNMLLVPVSMIVKIRRLTISRFAYAEDSNDYLVEYTADMSFALPSKDPVWDADPNLRQGGQMACDMANGTARLLGEEATVQAFHLYSDGWGVPELRQRGAGEAGLDAMVKGMMHKRR